MAPQNEKGPDDRALLAGVPDICSNHGLAGFTPDQLRELAVLGDRENGSSTAPRYWAQALPKRLGPKKVEDIVRRYQVGESARSLAEKHKVAPSAVLRLLRENNAVVKKWKVSVEDEQAMAREYEAGATMRGLEMKLGLSHGAVLRALDPQSVEMRAKGPRRKSA